MECNLPLFFSPEDRIVTRLVEQFRSASKSIDIAVYLIGSKTVANELVKAHRRGVAVRVVTDAKVAGTKYSMDDFLEAKGIPVRAVKVRAGSMHLKFLLIDGMILFAGSANLTNDANYRNHEFMIATEDQTLIDRFAAKFEDLWAIAKKQTSSSAKRKRYGEGGLGGVV